MWLRDRDFSIYPRRAGSVFFLLVAVSVLPVAVARGSHHPLAGRLEARLKAILLGRPDLSPDEVQLALARQLRVAPVPVKGSASPADPAFPTRQTLTDFYATMGHRLAWCDESGRILPASRTFLAALRRAGEHGLHPEDYSLGRLDSLRKKAGKIPLDDAAVARLADFDLLMTTAFFRYASDLSTGRVHPDEIRNDWHTIRPELDLVTSLGRALENDRLEELLEALPPPHRGYARLRIALSKLRKLESGGGWPAIPDGPELGPGSRGPRVSLLRRRLSVPAGREASVTREVSVSRTAAGASDRFDETLTDAVRRFQERHGIEPDGKVGATTLAALNVTVESGIRQVELNLERWRWIPRDLGDPHVFVNIPGFDLAIVRGGVPSWRTRIVVGKSYTPTPVFSDTIVAIVANPPWNVPRSILLAEYLPELRNDPAAFARRGLRLLEGPESDPREVAPESVDWAAMNKARLPYRLRQDPGPDNALGVVKFQLTNAFHVYLHDTPTRAAFGEQDRDLSHGCIRVEKPLELAMQLLGDSSKDLLRKALDQPKERHLPVKPAVPVHILYLTAWVDEDDILRFGPDIYGLDGPQQAAIDRARYRVPQRPVRDGKPASRAAPCPATHQQSRG